jgi:N-acyl-phosphatidylethanolamine-hydrolysing phospholipase D
VRITWLGHATFLLQIGGVNLLTDPMLSRSASPVRLVRIPRFSPPGLTVDELPPVDAVVLSHDHFDHLDLTTVGALRERFGAELTWVTPLGYRDWFARRGVRTVREVDWWESVQVEARGETEKAGGEATGSTPRRATTGRVTVTAAPAQHWTRRGLRVNARLWASFAVRAVAEAGADGAGAVAADGALSVASPAVYFGGDSGWFEGYAEIGRRLGPFDAHLLPIGAYAPRWFMKRAHMNPEEAVRAHRALREGAAGVEPSFIPLHWGTFRLSDEPPLEPPERLRAAWRAAGLDGAHLHVPGIGGTVVVERGRGG